MQKWFFKIFNDEDTTGQEIQDNTLREQALNRAKQAVDSEKYSAICTKYEHLTFDDYKRTKYLDLNTYLTRNVAQADRLGLLDGPPQKILDLGSGCGFFAYICGLYGHEVHCLDLPGIDIFADIMELFGLSRTEQAIKPMIRIDLPESGFDMVTGLMVKFDAIGEDDRFGPREWKFFLSDMIDNFLIPRGRIFLEFNKLPDLPLVEAANLEAFQLWGAEITGPDLGSVYLRDISIESLNTHGDNEDIL